MIKKISRKNSKRGKCSSTASSREEHKASASAVGREQNNAGVDQGEISLLEIVMARFETLNKSIVSLRQQDEPTSEEYQFDELTNPGEVDADSSEYSRLAKNYARAGLVGPEIHVDLAKLVVYLLGEKQDYSSFKQINNDLLEKYGSTRNCIYKD